MLAQPPLWLVLVAFVAALGPLVFFHELGHYLVGRIFGVGAETFSIGFGREVLGWTDKRGTRWKIGWLPLGGYVKFVGDMNPASAPASLDDVPAEQRSKNFHSKPVWQRFLIVLAGPATNFLLAILIFAAFFTLVGAPLSNVAGRVEPNSAAAKAGIVPGDRITAVAGRETATFSDLFNAVALRPNEHVLVEIEHEGAKRTLSVKLGAKRLDPPDQAMMRGVLGISPAPTDLAPLPISKAVPAAIAYTKGMVRGTVDGIGQILRGKISAKQIGGPLKIAQVAGEGASLGLLPFIQLIAMLSINLGFINLLPVPMLDGGHLLFYGIEAVRRRPVSERTVEWAFRGGMAAILALLLFTTANDLGSFGLWERLGRLIG